MPKREGIFITFEGTEGAGKSTLIRLLTERLQNIDRPIVSTREPGGSQVAERIRRVILEEEMDPWAELFLYEASRAEHLAKVIRPALAQGAIVLCDRYTDSSLAYQGHARGLPWKKVQALNTLATQNLRPDLTFLVEVDPAAGLKRAVEQTRFEAEGVAFQTRVRKGFLKSIKEDPKRWRKIDSNLHQSEQLAELALAQIKKRFKLKW